MTKVNYERVRKANLTQLGNVTTGEVIRWEDDLFVVTNSYEEDYRRIMNISSRAEFGTVEYVNENTDVELVEDVEITVKY